MVWTCRKEGCTFGDTGTCARAAEFSAPETECDDYLASRPQAPSGPPPVAAENTFPPWTGNAIGTDFAALMALSNPPLRVLVAGPPGSGKTTLLTGQFLDLDRVPHSGLPAEFAGSYTLHEYERMCDSAFRWHQGASAAVPRTPRGLERESAWLHLAFRFPTNGVAKHLLFSDMPGEAFVQWCNDKNAMPAATLSTVDVFWVVVDASRAGIKAERTAATDLIKRIRAESSGKRVQVILTKADKVIDLKAAVESKEVVHAARQLVADLQRAWGNDPLMITPVAALPQESAKKPGWQTLEPIGQLLAARPLPPVPMRTSLEYYVDYMGLGG